MTENFFSKHKPEFITSLLVSIIIFLAQFFGEIISDTSKISLALIIKWSFPILILFFAVAYVEEDIQQRNVWAKWVFFIIWSILAVVFAFLLAASLSSKSDAWQFTSIVLFAFFSSGALLFFPPFLRK